MRIRLVKWKIYGKAILLFIFIMLLICCTASCVAEKQESKKQELPKQEFLEESGEQLKRGSIPICFFHNTACGNCDGTEEFREVIEEQISVYQDECPYELFEYNVFKTSGKEKWDAMVEEYQLKNDSYIFPAMILEGKIYLGMEEIRKHLLSAFLDASGISAMYFYREDCSECQDMKMFWEQLPEKINCDGTEISCKVIKLESRTDTNGEKIRKLFEKYKIPEEDQMVPIVFLKEGYLAGKQEIETNLLQFLEEGKGFYSIKNGGGK